MTVRDCQGGQVSTSDSSKLAQGRFLRCTIAFLPDEYEIVASENPVVRRLEELTETGDAAVMVRKLGSEEKIVLRWAVPWLFNMSSFLIPSSEFATARETTCDSSHDFIFVMYYSNRLDQDRPDICKMYCTSPTKEVNICTPN